MKTKIFLFAALLLIILPTGNACADWLIYHKPAFEGQILDGETKEPIEGAVVVALYNKETFGWPGGSNSSVVNVRETLTDKDGRFLIPSYTTLIQPLSWDDKTLFVIFKPGYVSIDYLDDRDLESLFTGKMVGMQDYEYTWLPNKSQIFRYRAPNIVELPKPKTRQEKIRSLPSIPGPDIPAKKMKNLICLSNEERNKLGFGKEIFK